MQVTNKYKTIKEAKMKNQSKGGIPLVAAIMAAAMLLCAESTQAQYSHLYYHRTGDTIPYNTPIYYHNWWGFETSYHTNRHTANVGPKTPFEKKLLSYYFTPTPLKVIGIAAFSPCLGWNTYTESYQPPQQQEYMLIYEASPDSLYEVANAPWQAFYDTSRYIHIRGRRPANGGSGYWSGSDTVVCCGGIRWDMWIPVAEYYFDSPLVVYDSFYMGVTSYDDPHNLSPLDPAGLYCSDWQYWYSSNRYRTDCEGRVAPSYNDNSICGLSWPSIRYGFSRDIAGLDANDVVYTHTDFVPMVFPIIQVDTTVPPEEYCPPVENLAVHNLGGGTVEVTWDAHPDHRYGYDVQVGFLGQPLSAWTTRYSERNFVQIPDLEVGRMYNIRVRAFCDAEEVDISDWCDVLMFAVEDSTEVGMEPSPLSQHTTVAPNPSTHSVTVSSDFVIMSLDLYDAAGRHLWNQQVGRRSETLDLSSHAAGRYLLMVTTPHGTTPKVLIKQ